MVRLGLDGRIRRPGIDETLNRASSTLEVVMPTDPDLAPGSNGPYYVILDVEISDVPRYLTYMDKVLPALEAAGGRYLARGGAYTVYEGNWEPARLVLIEFPTQKAWESFYYGAAYEGIKTIRDETSTGNMVGVEGLAVTSNQ
jgi:uncharacterized protein (DUF1330 family)